MLLPGESYEFPDGWNVTYRALPTPPLLDSSVSGRNHHHHINWGHDRDLKVTFTICPDSPSTPITGVPLVVKVEVTRVFNRRARAYAAW